MVKSRGGDDMPNNLEKMAQLVRENPAITVKQIAKELGYSEERSVYYWLEKGKYKGIKDFKRAILADPTARYQTARQKTPHDASAARASRRNELLFRGHGGASAEGDAGPAGLRIAKGLRQEKAAGTAELLFYSDDEAVRFLEPFTVGYKAFAVIAPPEYVPVGEKDEDCLLIVDPLAPLDDGCLVLVKESVGFPVIRRYFSGAEVLFVHPLRQNAAVRRIDPAEASRLIIGRITHRLTRCGPRGR